jgi:hypothetical protein
MAQHLPDSLVKLVDREVDKVQRCLHQNSLQGGLSLQPHFDIE